MAEKYLTKTAFDSIMHGIEQKIPGEVNLNNNLNINRQEFDLLSSPATIWNSTTITNWVAIPLTGSMADYDEVAIKYVFDINSDGLNTRTKTLRLSHDDVISMNNISGTSDVHRYIDAMPITPDVNSSTIMNFVRVFLRVDDGDYATLYGYSSAKDAGTPMGIVTIDSVIGVKYVDVSNDSPIGTVISVIGVNPPPDYLLADGSAYNITDYGLLAEYIKSQFGSYNYFGGNGITTFAVPKLSNVKETTLWTGTMSSSGTIALLDDYTKYDEIGFYNIVDVSSTTKRPIFRTLKTSTIQQVVSTASNGTTASTTWGFEGYTDYCDVQYISTAYNLSVVLNLTTVTKVVGIKYDYNDTNTIKCIKYTPENNNISNYYSTTEKIIGTWVDGKALYQKTYSGTTPSIANSNTNFFVDSDLLAVDTIVSVDGCINDGNSNWVVINESKESGFEIRIWISLLSGSVRGNIASSYTSKPIHVTIKYTKN